MSTTTGVAVVWWKIDGRKKRPGSFCTNQIPNKLINSPDTPGSIARSRDNHSLHPIFSMALSVQVPFYPKYLASPFQIPSLFFWRHSNIVPLGLWSKSLKYDTTRVIKGCLSSRIKLCKWILFTEFRPSTFRILWYGLNCLNK